MDRPKRLLDNQPTYSYIYTIILFLGLLLITAIALLVWYLVTPVYSSHSNIHCPPDPCSSTTRISDSSIQTNEITGAMYASTSGSSVELITGQKRSYNEPCDRLYDCYTEYGLLCVHGWSGEKRCLCEGSHYWSAPQRKCLRKGEVNATCEVDYQCHREIGFVCDQPPDAATKRCICAADLYWAKDSNCGQTRVHRIVDCTDEPHATTCLVLAMNSTYHMVTIRSLTEKELSVDWFLIDNRVLVDLPQLSCAFNNDTKYCFGLNAQRSLQLAQFTRQGFHSIENLGGTNRGTTFGLANINTVTVFVRSAQNTLYSRTIADDEVLPAHDIAPLVSGDPTCYVQDLVTTRHRYCFARNAAYGLSEYAELSTNAWQATQLGNASNRIRDETAPVCSYVGQVHRYCFAIFENGQIYRILFDSNGWGSWQSMGEGRLFLTSPVFLTSKPSNQSAPGQTCYLIAIDTSNLLQLSTNLDCALSDGFSTWLPIESSRRFKQFDKPFRLRDGHIGVLGVDADDQPYYVYLDSETSHFTALQPALTVKPEQFRP